MQFASRPLWPTSWSGPISPVTGTACLVFAAAAGGAVFAPLWFWLPLAIATLIAIAVLAFRHTTLFCVAWLLIAGATLEMALMDFVGPAAFQPTIAAVKAAQLGLAVLCMLHYGLAPDVFNPGLAFLAIFLAGLVHGLHPDLSLSESLRSLAGSVAPFAFAFSRLPRNWGSSMVRATAWIPVITVTVSAMLATAGLRPLFVEAGGQRLAGLGHPAFLAGICLTAIYACLVGLYREGQSRWLFLLVANFVILVLTGARVPLACAVAVTGLTLIFLRSTAFPRRYRVLPMLLAACLLPLLVMLANDLSGVRLFNVLSNEAADLSGRNLLWPPFEQAAAASPWFGWGLGAGNAIIAPDSELARLIQSWAAHNEYLRMVVEGGQLGRALLIILFVLWVTRHTARLCRTDKVIMRLAFLAFAVHAYTDNVLIATTGCVFFAFATAVFTNAALAARGEGGVGSQASPWEP